MGGLLSDTFEFPSYISTTNPTTSQTVIDRIKTFQDAIDKVLDAHNADYATENVRKVRGSVMGAYREFHGLHAWTYYRRRGTIATEASQQTGTVTYTHSTRTVTLSGSTWPDSIEHYRLNIDGKYYTIQDKTSSTTIILPESDNPGEDVAAGTAYILYRAQYPAPADVGRGTRMFGFNNLGYSPRHVDPNTMIAMQTLMPGTTGIIEAYTIMTDPSGQMVFEFTPIPNVRDVYRYVYVAIPRPLQLFGTAAEYVTGTVTVSGTSVTGSGTTWTDDMVGCVMRFSSTVSAPTGVEGRKNLDNPYAEQSIITAVNSATSITLSSAPTGTYSGAAYSIGAPLDIDPVVAMEAFYRFCEWKYAVDVTKYGERDTRKALFERSLEEARGNDHRPGLPSTIEIPNFPTGKPVIVARLGGSSSS